MQKLDKPVELEGRVIRYKPIVKRIVKKNNQVGGALKVGDHIKCLITTNNNIIEIWRGHGVLRSSVTVENRWIVTKIFPKYIKARNISTVHNGICQ